MLLIDALVFVSKKGIGDLMADKVKCLGCRKLLTWREQRFQFGSLTALGIGKEDAKTITPRCASCVADYLRSGVLRHPTRLNIEKRPVYWAQVQNAGWADLYGLLQQPGTDFVCVRSSPATMLVVTTLKMPVFSSVAPKSAAMRVQKAIADRPRDIKVRFVASENWGG